MPTSNNARVLAARGSARHRDLLAHELRHRTCVMWSHVIAYQYAPAGENLGARFLRAAYEDGVLRNRRLAFGLLELIEDPHVVRNVEKALRFGSSRLRGDALEVLSNLGDREAARLLVLMHETGPLAERMRAALSVVRAPRDTEAVLEAARRWLSPAS